MKILVPKVLPTDPELEHLPWFFVVGPVLGGGDWQKNMCWALYGLMHPRDFVAVIPCRWTGNHPLATYFIEGPPMQARQTSWERRMLAYAAHEMLNGCIVAYLAKQVAPRPPEAGVYARDTLGEIGEWRGRMMYDSAIRFVLGADPEFDQNGISVMKQNFDEALGLDFPIHRSIADTAKAAVAFAA